MQSNPQTARFSPSVERSVLLLIGAVQFVNILDFMMVMPLGPDFAPALGINTSDLGWVGGSYTAASAFAGVVSSLFIDRFDRKVALLAALAGLCIATALGGLAWNLPSLLVARICAGLCGGPATSVAWSIVADVIEPARRGSAMGKVMGAFSLASILGVPFGLEVAQLAGWKAPFFVTATLGLIAMLLIARLMPSLTFHLQGPQQAPSFRHLYALLKKPINLMTYTYIAIAMVATFMIIPNLSAFMQYNLHYPRKRLGLLYALGGTASFFTMRITGRMIDRFNATATSTVSAVTYIFVLWITFISATSLPAPAFFILLMFALGMRNVSSTTLATKIPTPQERASFMSLFSCMQGIGMAAGAFFSTAMLSENADKSLAGMDRLARIAIILTVIVPLIISRVEGRLTRPQ